MPNIQNIANNQNATKSLNNPFHIASIYGYLKNRYVNSNIPTYVVSRDTNLYERGIIETVIPLP
jgi:hypothetical protein